MVSSYTIAMHCRKCDALIGFRYYGDAPMSENWICTECYDGDDISTEDAQDATQPTTNDETRG